MRRICFALLPFMLAGCVSVLPEPVVPDGLYRLSSPSVPLTVTDIILPADVLVREPDGSSLLLGKSVVYEKSSGSLTLLSKAQWSDSASRMMQALLLDRLAELSPESKGHVLSDQMATMAPLEMNWRIRDFVVRDSDASVALRVTVVTARKRELVGQFDVSRQVDFTGKLSEDGVEALIQAARLAVDDIAKRLPEALSGYQAPSDS